MSDNRRHLEDGEAGAGSVSLVTRDGGTIRRPAGPWTPAVHELLQHLSTKGYAYSPRVHATEKDIEVLDYIEGEVALRPWPLCLLDDAGVIAIAGAIQAYHQAIADFVPPPGSVWRCAETQWVQGMIIRHGDLGPWNLVWREGGLVGIIDWDMAEPGFPIDDIAQIAWQCVPLRPPHHCAACGLSPGSSQTRRFALLCDAFGYSTSAVMEAIQHLQITEAERIQRLGTQGMEPWAAFYSRGDVSSIEEDRTWLEEFSKTR